jgi:hypothetical protein
MQCNLRFDECYVHDDHYVIVVHDVLVFFVTNNRQLICQFHELLVTDNAMMDITFFMCGSSSSSSVLHKRDTPSLVHVR